MIFESRVKKKYIYTALLKKKFSCLVEKNLMQSTTQVITKLTMIFI